MSVHVHLHVLLVSDSNTMIKTKNRVHRKLQQGIPSSFTPKKIREVCYLELVLNVFIYFFYDRIINLYV